MSVARQWINPDLLLPFLDQVGTLGSEVRHSATELILDQIV